MSGDIKISKKSALAIIATIGCYAMADFVSIVDIKSTGGLNVTGGITETQLNTAIEEAVIEAKAELLSEIQKGSPVGTISIWSKSTPPEGWLELNGDSVPSQYTELSNLIGSTLPDLRGQFVRGWDNGAGIDEDSTRALGSEQLDQIQNITGRVLDFTSNSSRSEPGGPNGAFYGDQNNYGYNNSVGFAGNYIYPDKIMFDASRVVRAGSETRSRNIALMYIIKAE